ncbi:hypothetical protein T07_13768 [Trichinella nelsoni]|uniref:Uncharacterized protein n=1 Tax=Trichinella nelsoni TaxID=6336 RepID=A0A0V0RZH1_9BILA|nr:hypothetical protein T07_13768 [Trichinella nelsoni]
MRTSFSIVELSNLINCSNKNKFTSFLSRILKQLLIVASKILTKFSEVCQVVAIFYDITISEAKEFLEISDTIKLKPKCCTFHNLLKS